MEVSIEVVKEAKERSLLTLHDAKLGLNLMSVQTDFSDNQIEMLIKWASNEISTMCNRVFAQQTVIETILDLQSPRIFLSQYPVKEITEVKENGTVLLPVTDYNLDADSGKLTRMNGTFWSTPVVIKYTGGYDLPQKAPPELASAALLITREARNASLRGDASIRMISHKQSRIIYFDPNVAAKAAGGGTTSGGTAAHRAVTDLIRSFTRFVV